MKNRISSPPLIILLDLLFLLVFILILNENNQISIELPKYRLFDGSILTYDVNGIKYIINQKTKNIEKKYYPQSQFEYFKKCQQQCREYKKLDRNDLYIIFPNRLFNEISKITYIASHTKYNCKNLKFKIKDNGKIDYKKLLENICLSKIKGIDNLK